MSHVDQFQRKILSGTTSEGRNPLVITACLTGNVTTRTAIPTLPVTPEEISDDAAKCVAAGASIIHIHARDEDANPTLEVKYFKEIARLIRQKAPEAIMQFSTGQRAGPPGREGWPARMGPVTLLPEMATYCCGSNNLGKSLYEASPEFLDLQAKCFNENNVVATLEIFEMGQLYTFHNLLRKGLLKSPMYNILLLLGSAGGIPANAEQLSMMVNSVPHGDRWTVAGIGKSQMAMATLGIAMGGDVRVGLEDYYFDADNGTITSNVELVEKCVKIAKMIGRPVATCEGARKLYSVPEGHRDRIQQFL